MNTCNGKIHIGTSKKRIRISVFGNGYKTFSCRVDWGGQCGDCLLKALHMPVSRPSKCIAVRKNRLNGASIAGCLYTTDLRSLCKEADLYICVLKDAVLETVLKQVPDFGKGLWVHTSGSLPMSVFAPYTSRYGVLYPLQTFSKQREVSFDEIPICLETASMEDMTVLKVFAVQLSHSGSGNGFFPACRTASGCGICCNFTNSLMQWPVYFAGIRT